MIKFVLKSQDKITGKQYNIGDQVDLGKERNENAVSQKIAVFVDSRDFEKEVERIESEKQEVKSRPKVKTNKKNIETK